MQKAGGLHLSVLDLVVVDEAVETADDSPDVVVVGKREAALELDGLGRISLAADPGNLKAMRRGSSNSALYLFEVWRREEMNLIFREI